MEIIGLLTVQLLVAVPTGILCDVFRRDQMLRVAAFLGLLAGLVLALVMVSPTIHLGYLGVAAVLLGCYRGMYSVALESIFADSVEAGRRYVIRMLSYPFVRERDCLIDIQLWWINYGPQFVCIAFV